MENNEKIKKIMEKNGKKTRNIKRYKEKSTTLANIGHNWVLKKS